MSSTQIRFNRSDITFTKELNRRVNDYFKTNNISKHANGTMIGKTVVMLSIYLIPYFLLYTGWFGFGGLILMMLIMGIGEAGIGLSIMHDANHGAYSKNPRVNKILGYTVNLVGANATNWKIQHNVFHHTYTNILEHDEDISPKVLFRFTPHSKLRKIHKYQHIYAWFFYTLMTISWLLVKDYKQLAGYKRSGLLQKQNLTPAKAWSWMIFTKVVYIGYVFVLPVVFLGFAWWQVIIGFVLMQGLAGFILAIIFQPAHVSEGLEFPLANEKGDIEEEWTVHQLRTTANFAKNSKIFSYYVGGLNFQVEHHLFPTICHVHYKKLSDIVKSTAEEFGVPYNSTKTFVGALVEHWKHLRRLGQPA